MTIKFFLSFYHNKSVLNELNVYNFGGALEVCTHPLTQKRFVDKLELFINQGMAPSTYVALPYSYIQCYKVTKLREFQACGLENGPK